MSQAVFNVAVWKERKQYVSQCLNVDVASFGKTKKEALKSLEEALELYFEDQPFSRATKVEHPDIVHLILKRA